MTKEVRNKLALLILFVLMGLPSLLCLHCACDSNGDGDDGSDSGAGLCQEDEARCDGDMVVLCRLGTWQSWENCAAIGETCVESDTDASCEPIDSGTPDAAADW